MCLFLLGFFYIFKEVMFFIVFMKGYFVFRFCYFYLEEEKKRIEKEKRKEVKRREKKRV